MLSLDLHLTGNRNLTDILQTHVDIKLINALNVMLTTRGARGGKGTLKYPSAQHTTMQSPLHRHVVHYSLLVVVTKMAQQVIASLMVFPGPPMGTKTLYLKKKN